MASTILTRTVASTGNNKILTWSGWVKRSDSSTGQLIAANGNPSDGNYIIFFEFTGAGLRFIIKSSSILANVETNAVFRDTSAWYHLVFNMDTTQATASDRIKMYVNGEQITSFATATYPSQNLGTQFNNASSVISVGGKYISGANTDFFNGSMSHVHFIDGTVYGPSAFGETDTTTGQWKIKTSPSVTYGTNGFFILKDGNSVTDQSGNSNNLTVGAGTLTKTEDCPDNVFATLNPLALTTRQTLSNGNLTGTSSSWTSAISTIGVTTGKWYAEVKYVNATGNIMVGVMDEQDMSSLTGGTGGLGFTTNSVGYYSSDGTKFIGDSASSYGASYTANDILGIAVDLDSGTKTVTFYKNGASQGAINLPTTGTGTFFIGTSTTSNGVTSINFGNGYFGSTQISSAGTNASGIGIFEHDVPANHTALSTKGLNL